MSQREDKQMQEIVDFFAGKDQVEVERLRDKYDAEYDAEMKGDYIKLMYYVLLREQGVAPVWAAMSACRHGVRQSGSNDAFWEHARRRMEAKTPYMTKKMLEMAHGAGINTHGRVHMPGLGAFDNPDAWVSSTSDILDVCRRRNLSCEGVVKHNGVEVPRKPVQLAEDLIDEMIQLEREVDPDADKRCRKNPEELKRLRGLVVEKYGQPKSKMPI